MLEERTVVTNTLVVMAKAPQPGLCKTRIGHFLGHEFAADLQRAMILDCLCREWPVERRLLAWSGESDLWHVAQDLGWMTMEQKGGDLGHRMQVMADSVIQDSQRVIILGTDTPDLPESLFRECLSADVGHGPAFGPAADGGYWGIVFGDRHFGVLTGVTWSSATVLSESLSIALKEGLHPVLLPWWADVDTVADLQRLRLHSEASHSRDRPANAVHTFRLLQSKLVSAFTS